MCIFGNKLSCFGPKVANSDYLVLAVKMLPTGHIHGHRQTGREKDRYIQTDRHKHKTQTDTQTNCGRWRWYQIEVGAAHRGSGGCT